MNTSRTIAIGDIHGCSTALDALIGAIRPRPEDTIVTLGDWAVARPYAGYAAYFPSKGAIPTLTRTLAVELGSAAGAVAVTRLGARASLPTLEEVLRS